MKILQLSHFKAEYGGNFIQQIIHLVNYLEKKNIESILVFPQEAKNKTWCINLIQEGYDIRFLDESYKTFRQIKFLKKIIKTENVTHIHSHFGLYDNISFLLSIILNIKHIAHVRALSSGENILLKIKRNFRYKILSLKTTMIAISDAVHEELLADGYNFNKIIKVEDGIDFSRINQINFNTKKSDRLSFLMFGYDIQVKGVDIVIDAIMELSQKYNIKLNIVVAANKEEFDLFLKEKFKKTNNITWLNILSPTNNISDYYSNNNCFISASRKEGFSNALCEAIYSQLPSIVSDIEGTKWSNNLPSVIVFKNGDVKSLVDCIEFYIKNMKVIQRQTVKSREIIINKYNIEDWCEKIYYIY